MKWLTCATALLAMGGAAMAQGRVVTAPAPEGAAVSHDYTVKVNGRPVAVYAAPVWYPTYVKPFGGPYSFATFDFSGTARVEITTDKPLDHLAILPASRGLRPAVNGKTLTFSLTRPCQLSVEPDAKNGPLLLFANPLEREVPSQSDTRVKYYGPGVHKAGQIELRDGETLYLAPGAVVIGGVHANGRNIRICGRGILDGGAWERFKGPGRYVMDVDRCTDLVLEGIILKDSWSWVTVVTGSRNVTIRNLKVCSTRCENNDGLDVVNSQNVRVSDCFIRSDDDCIAPKGLGEWLGKPPYPPVENLTVERCVLWTDRANVWRLACESRASEMRHFVFRDIDVIHYTDPTCPVIVVQPAEGMTMEDVRFEDIRIHHEGQEKFIELDPHATIWAKSQTPGTIRNVLFRNVTLSGGAGSPTGQVVLRGVDEAHPIENVVFENVTRHGQKLTALSPGITISGTVRGVQYR